MTTIVAINIGETVTTVTDTQQTVADLIAAGTPPLSEEVLRKAEDIYITNLSSNVILWTDSDRNLTGASDAHKILADAPDTNGVFHWKGTFNIRNLKFVTADNGGNSKVVLSLRGVV